MFCKKTKEFLSSIGVAFADRDITADEEALNDLQKLGVMTTPVVVIEGSVIVGFDPQKIEAELQKS